MSTIDTLINAASAIGIYDIYKPLIKPKADDKHYLKSARWFSILSTVIGLFLAVWFFQQKGTLMTIHYKGIMMIIPSIVATLIMGILWKRFNGAAACSALAVGAVMSLLTVFFPEWIYPLRDFAYGSAAEDPIYFRALFGVLVAVTVGVVVTLFTKPPQESHIKGYTVDSILVAMRNFKNGEPNLSFGKRVKGLHLTIDNSLPKGQIAISKKAAEKLKAFVEDIVYVADNRWYLGGLRSGHFLLGSVRESLSDSETDKVFLSQDTLKQSYLLFERLVFLKKII